MIYWASNKYIHSFMITGPICPQIKDIYTFLLDLLVKIASTRL